MYIRKICVCSGNAYKTNGISIALHILPPGVGWDLSNRLVVSNTFAKSRSFFNTFAMPYLLQKSVLQVLLFDYQEMRLVCSGFDGFHIIVNIRKDQCNFSTFPFSIRKCHPGRLSELFSV